MLLCSFFVINQRRDLLELVKDFYVLPFRKLGSDFPLSFFPSYISSSFFAYFIAKHVRRHKQKYYTEKSSKYHHIRCNDFINHINLYVQIFPFKKYMLGLLEKKIFYTV
jgi:hypothetical protein